MPPSIHPAHLKARHSLSLRARFGRRIRLVCITCSTEPFSVAREKILKLGTASILATAPEVKSKFTSLQFFQLVKKVRPSLPLLLFEIIAGTPKRSSHHHLHHRMVNQYPSCTAFPLEGIPCSVPSLLQPSIGFLCDRLAVGTT